MVVVLNQKQKILAQKLYKTGLVFIIDEIKGLEYEHIILHELFSAEDPDVIEINKLLTKTIYSYDLRKSRPKKKEDKSKQMYTTWFN